MAIFDYKAIDGTGKNTKGIVEAEGLKQARAKLKKSGLMVTTLVEKNSAQQKKSSNIPFMSGRASVADVSLMTRQLASLIKANIPLVEALGALVDQTDNTKLKVVLAQVRQEVNEGTALSKACAAHPKVFDTISINMIEAGESSGTLAIVLLKLADLKEAQMRLRGKIISGMTYPALMGGVGLLLMLGIFAFVMPKMAKIFESMNKPMPPTAALMIKVSDLIINWWYLLVAGGFVAVTALNRYIASPQGRPKWDAFKLKAPVVGPLLRMIAMTRFSNTMSTLLASGVPIISAMNIARNLVDNVPISKAIANARDNITEGQSISEPLKRSGEFPPMVIHMIAIGEKTGELPNMLRNVAETYEEQVNTKIEGLTSLLEPIMIVGMGLAVGFIVITVITPLMDMTNINQR